MESKSIGESDLDTETDYVATDTRFCYCTLLLLPLISIILLQSRAVTWSANDSECKTRQVTVLYRPTEDDLSNNDHVRPIEMIKYEGVECTCSNALPYYTYMALVVDTVRIVWFMIVDPRAVSGVGKIVFSTFLNIVHFYPALLLLGAVLLSEWECGLLLWTWSIISSIWRFGIIASSCYLDYYYHFRNRKRKQSLAFAPLQAPLLKAP